MKSPTKILLFLFISLILFNCTKEDEIPIDVEINDFVWKGLNAYYLYQDQVPDLSDRRFNNQPELNNYLRAFTDPNELFISLLHDRPVTDNKSTLINDVNTISTPSIRTSFTNGMEYGIIAEPGSTTNVLGYAHYILPDSDAEAKNLKRGDFFYGVNDTQLTRDNYRTLLANTDYTLNMAIFDGIKVEEDSLRTPTDTIPKKIILSKSGYTHKPVFITKNFVNGADNIGYLMYNHDFSTTYLNDLNNAFLELKNFGVNQLILDLRYNVGGGSSIDNINQLASMITGQFKDQTFAKKKWNSKAQPWFEANQPDSLITKFTDKLYNSNTINSLELTDVYIILNGTSSSIELLTNSLRSYINVHLVNYTNTVGNNTGSITLYNSIDYDSIGRSINHDVVLQPIAFEILNNDDETFENGFSPEIRTCIYEDILKLGVLGEESDPVLSTLYNTLIGNPLPPGFLWCNTMNNFEVLFNSVNQYRIFDTGIIIEQDLPNTN